VSDQLCIKENKISYNDII